MIASISWPQSALNSFPNRILICQSCSQIFKLFHPPEGTIISPHTVNSSCILISRHDIMHTHTNKTLFRYRFLCFVLPRGGGWQQSQTASDQTSHTNMPTHDTIHTILQTSSLNTVWPLHICATQHKWTYISTVTHTPACKLTFPSNQTTFLFIEIQYFVYTLPNYITPQSQPT